MIIVLINWRVTPEKVPAFIEFWSSTLKLEGAPGLVGEFLSKVEGLDFYEKITWQIEPNDEEDRSFWKSEIYDSFVNVGIWESLADFDRAVGPKMNPDPKFMGEYEAAPRRRAILSPAAWRIGASALPKSSSPGVIA
jgi:Antibiotic biosynthesis monooxygenase